MNRASLFNSLSRRAFFAASLACATAVLVAGSARGDTVDCREPNVLILLDVSGSMNQTVGGVSLYTMAQKAIHQVTFATEADIRFGLMVFPEPGPSPVHCNVGTDLAVNMDLYNWEPIHNYLSPTYYPDYTTLNPGYFGGPRSHHDTPMFQALTNAGDLNSLLDPERRNYILLVTDGVQDCCNGGDYNDTPDCRKNPDGSNMYKYTDPEYHDPEEFENNRQDLINLVTQLREEKNIQTFVVGFTSLVDPPTLNGMAQAAGTAIDGCDATSVECYYQANNQQELLEALGSIAQIVREEVCDGIDNDCNGIIDDGLDVACETECGTGYMLCIDGEYQECNAPQPEEEVCDGIDNNCNGIIDEGCDCVHGDTQVCGSSVGVCETGLQTCIYGAWGPCEGGISPSPEVCDGEDNNCDGAVDEGCECTNGDTRRCGTDVGECKAGTQTCVNGQWGVCEGAVWPALDDPCDGLDNNCNGIIDEYCHCVHGYHRACGSSVGECAPGVQTCEHGEWGPCTDITGPTQETCNNKDDDCDGYVDNGALCPGNQACRCGQCVGPCAADGSCSAGDCVNGYCVVDDCPDGYYCDGYLCAFGDPSDGDGGDGNDSGGMGDDTGMTGDKKVVPSGAEGCRCHGNASPVGALPFMLLVGMFGLWQRRRRFIAR